MKRLLPIGFLVLLLWTGSSIAHAQDGVTANDEARLTSLYKSLLKYPEDNYLQQRVADVRAEIREKIQDALLQSLESIPETPPQDGQEAPKVIDQQRAVVRALEDQLNAQKIDLDLLQAEGDKYYGSTPPPEDVEELRLTTTHEELLAKVAIAEERISVLESVLTRERERLTKLTRDQWITQFSDIIRIATFLGIIAAVVIFERIVRGMAIRRITQPQKRYVVSKIVTTIIYAIVAIWLVTTLFSERPGILTSFAIVGAGLAVALQDVVKDAVGWALVLQKRLFALGDRVSVGPYTGDVVDISLLRTTLLEVNTSPAAAVQERTGRTLSMPNAAVLTHDVLNFHKTSDFLKTELRIVLTLESNWEKAERIIKEILEEVTGKYTEAARRQHAVRTRTLFVAYEPTGPQIYMDVVSDGIELTLRFSTPIGMRRDVVTEIMQAILRRFAGESDIGLAYKTSMTYNPEKPPPPLFGARITESKRENAQ